MGKIHSIQQITENTHLNFYSMEVEDRKGKTFPYYMASRAKTQAELKMNSGQGPDHPVHAAMPETAYLKCFIAQVG